MERKGGERKGLEGNGKEWKGVERKGKEWFYNHSHKERRGNVMKIGKKDCYKQDLKIPKGYRLMKASELLIEIEKGNKKLIGLCNGNGVWVDYRGEVRAAFVVFKGGFFTIYGSLIGIDCSRGVFKKKMRARWK